VQNGAVGDRSWVILPFLYLGDFQLNALKPAWILDEMMVARDGVEPPTPAFSGPSTELPNWQGISGCC
jgi:hypothetical protein